MPSEASLLLIYINVECNLCWLCEKKKPRNQTYRLQNFDKPVLNIHTYSADIFELMNARKNQEKIRVVRLLFLLGRRFLIAIIELMLIFDADTRLDQSQQAKIPGLA